jgi:nucleoside-diphosphate-sugar epimerase
VIVPDSLASERTLHISLTGGTGYVGSALLQLIATMPVNSVKVNVLARSASQLLAVLGWPVLPSWLRVIEGRLPEVPGALFFDKPHVLVHFAVKQIDHDGSGFQQTNVEGTSALLAKTNAHTSGVIYGSTLSVLGQGAQLGVTEQAPLYPQTDLAKSRAVAEALCYEWATLQDKTAYGLRPRFILGRNDRYVLPGLARLVEKKQSVGDGSQQFSVIAVEDYARVILGLCRYMRSAAVREHTPVNVGYRESIRFRDLHYMLAQALSVSTTSLTAIPTYRWLPWLMRRLPLKGIAQKATQLELIGFDHYADVKALEERIGSDITGKPTRETVREIIRQWVVYSHGQDALASGG